MGEGEENSWSAMITLSLPPPRTLRCLCRKPGALTTGGDGQATGWLSGGQTELGALGSGGAAAGRAFPHFLGPAAELPVVPRAGRAPCGSLLPGLGEREGLWGPLWGRHPLPSRLPWLVCDHSHPTPVGTLRGDLIKKSSGPNEVCQINGSVAWPVCCAAYSHNWILEPPLLLLG